MDQELKSGTFLILNMPNVHSSLEQVAACDAHLSDHVSGLFITLEFVSIVTLVLGQA